MAKKLKKTKRRDAFRTRLVHIGDLGVDSGQIIMGDPCLLNPEVEEPDCPRDELGVGYQVRLMTGLGDGVYPVIAEEIQFDGDPDWSTITVTVEFAIAMRGRGCRKAFPHPYERSCDEGKTK